MAQPHVEDDSADSPGPVTARPDPDARRLPALIAGVAAAVLFVALRFVVALDGGAPLPIDAWWASTMQDLQSPVWLFVAWVPAIVGGTIGMIVIGVVIIAVFLIRKRRWDAANVAAAMVVVVAIGAPLASVIGRQRPDWSLAESVPTSFPSGHTAVATTVTLTLALLLRRWYVWAGAVTWIVLMMWSRTYLGAHWLSDVFAGMLEGIAVSMLVWVAIEALRDRRALRREAQL
ncbi:phosphatase PAP2 family protein [Microbacterium hominis]|uniref:Phosphatase PAP2 family protein n=1 Tax=Microbacterium hominis TaxID=162426 RepID=A0A7D4QBB0_9MICO|nr:phosphatase PAP2 family protein [Microbacterium hominis]QKJ18357.1 phosphatase PAP2 family protein [Microbacterium hominis]